MAKKEKSWAEIFAGRAEECGGIWEALQDKRPPFHETVLLHDGQHYSFAYLEPGLLGTSRRWIFKRISLYEPKRFMRYKHLQTEEAA